MASISDSDTFLEHLEQVLQTKVPQPEAVRLTSQIEKAREQFQENFHRLHYQFIRAESELNRLDRPQWFFEYLVTHYSVWVDQERRRKADPTGLALMVSSCILQKFLLQKQTAEAATEEEGESTEVVEEITKEFLELTREFLKAHDSDDAPFKFFEHFKFYEAFSSEQLRSSAVSKFEEDFIESQGALPIASSSGEHVEQTIDLLQQTLGCSPELRGSPEFKKRVASALTTLVLNQIKDQVRSLFPPAEEEQLLTKRQASELISIVTAVACWKEQSEIKEVESLLESLRSILSWKICSKAVAALLKNPGEATAVFEAAASSIYGAFDSTKLVGRERITAEYELKKISAEWMIMAKQDLAQVMQEENQEQLAPALSWLSIQLSSE